MVNKKEELVWAVLRISFALIFLWAFFDKLLGLGFATASENAWINGASPTSGFLSFAVHGPLSEFYKSLAGNMIIDFLFMAGLFFIGVALLFGIGVRVAGCAGALLMFLMWTSLLPPENHPFLDEHIIYLIVLLGIAIMSVGDNYGLGKWWSTTKLVRKHKILQ